MAMSHKAFAFNWSAFARELLPLLVDALQTGHRTALVGFVETNLSRCTDPCSGELLSADWLEGLEAGDVQELGDFALTKYYNPADDHGLGEEWMRIEAALPPEVRPCLLGASIGPLNNRFDPGRMGSYFQDEKTVARSLVKLRSPGEDDALLTAYREFLADVRARRRGLYVTF